MNIRVESLAPCMLTGFPPAGIPPGHEIPNYFPYGDDRVGLQGIKDTHSRGSAYDYHLQSSQFSSFGPGEASGNFGGGARSGRPSVGMPGLPPLGELPLMGGPRSAGLDMTPNGRDVLGRIPVDPMSRPGRDVLPLPREATNTLFIEGLPPDSTKREVARIL
ncbi:Rna-binding protein like [Thalictrum thalictroides]|uniref:Rna-binding protein like n=1 Tax=Thalictrum thalictroides TaxID=46969 RepID=A0A7J6X0B9_THATH|nr:Rna-binding protein like [Thalictrum thalictroides]